MKTTELILIALALADAVLQLMHIPYSGISLSLIILALAFFYYIFGFALFNEIKFQNILKKQTYQNLQSRNLIYAVANGWIISVILIGSLFLMEKLSYAGYIFTVGFILAAFFILLSLALFFKTKLRFYTRVFSRLIIACIIAASVYFIL